MILDRASYNGEAFYIENTNCKARRYNDEYHCGHCGLIWSINEDKPKCETQKQRSKRLGNQVIQQVRDQLNGN